LTTIPVSATHKGMGRKKEIDTKVLATLHEGTLERIAAVLEGDENRTTFIRTAIETEIRKRERAKRKADASE
jgi:hypothetical protein